MGWISTKAVLNGILFFLHVFIFLAVFYGVNKYVNP